MEKIYCVRNVDTRVIQLGCFWETQTEAKEEAKKLTEHSKIKPGWNESYEACELVNMTEMRMESELSALENKSYEE